MGRHVLWRGLRNTVLMSLVNSSSRRRRRRRCYDEGLKKFTASHHHHKNHWLDSPTRGPGLPHNFCQLKYPAIASSYFVTRVFSWVGLSAPRPTPCYPGGPMFSVRVVSPSRLYPILKRQDLAFSLAWLSHINVAQEPWRGHACNGLGRNNWHYSSFVSVQLSAGCVPSRPRTAPSTPLQQVNILLSVLKTSDSRCSLLFCVTIPPQFPNLFFVVTHMGPPLWSSG
jgi:hypothetical protein